jgi:hypothetical protein
MQQQSAAGIAPMPGPEAKANAQLRESALKEERRETMKSYRGNAIAVGVLFILCSAAAILSIVPLGAVGAPVDFAKLAANDNRVVLTALIEFVWAATGMGIAIGLYPILRKFNPALALGSVAGRVVENVFVLVGALSLLVLLTVSQQAVGSAAPSSFQATGDALVAVRDWVFGFVALIPFGIGTLMYNYVFYKSRLVPRWLSGWGLVAIVLSMVAAVYAGFTQDFGFTTVNNMLSAPIGLQEMVLAVWLIVKGFNLLPISPSKSTRS